MHRTCLQTAKHTGFTTRVPPSVNQEKKLCQRKAFRWQPLQRTHLPGTTTKAAGGRERSCALLTHARNMQSHLCIKTRALPTKTFYRCRTPCKEHACQVKPLKLQGSQRRTVPSRCMRGSCYAHRIAHDSRLAYSFLCTKRKRFVNEKLSLLTSNLPLT